MWLCFLFAICFKIAMATSISQPTQAWVSVEVKQGVVHVLLIALLQCSLYGCGFAWNFNDIHGTFTNLIRPPGSLPPAVSLVKLGMA